MEIFEPIVISTLVLIGVCIVGIIVCNLAIKLVDMYIMFIDELCSKLDHTYDVLSNVLDKANEMIDVDQSSIDDLSEEFSYILSCVKDLVTKKLNFRNYLAAKALGKTSDFIVTHSPEDFIPRFKALVEKYNIKDLSM